MEVERQSGVLLHPTSLPGRYGIGSLNRAAYEWVDFLAATHQSLWQVLPLGPTGYGDSPYQSFSSFAGNPYLISLEELADDGLLNAAKLANAPDFPPTGWTSARSTTGSCRCWREAAADFAAHEPA